MNPLKALMTGKPPGVQGDIAEAYRLGRDSVLTGLRTVAALPLEGCGDHGCVVAVKPGGMGTNGGCQCTERQLRRAVQILKGKLDARDMERP